MSHAPESSHQNFGLSEPAFNELKEALQRGEEDLFMRVFTAHFERCMSFLKGKYRAGHNDAYDAVMWSIIRFRQLLVDGKVSFGNLEAYLLRMAVTRYLRDQKAAAREVPSEQPQEFAEAIETDPADEESLDALAAAWEKLGDLCRKLLRGVYYDGADMRTMTAVLGDSSEANTRKRKERCIKELRRHFFDLQS